MCQTKTNNVRFCDCSQMLPSNTRSSWLLRPHPAAVDTGVLQLNFHKVQLHLTWNTNLITWLITCLWDHMSKYSSASSTDTSYSIYLNFALLLPCWHGPGSKPSFSALTLTDSENKTYWSELEEVEEEGCPVPPFLTEIELMLLGIARVCVYFIIRVTYITLTLTLIGLVLAGVLTSTCSNSLKEKEGLAGFYHSNRSADSE